MLSARRVSLRIAVSPWSAARPHAPRFFFRDRNASSTAGPQKPSLIEQLFPEETRRYEQQQQQQQQQQHQRQAPREVPPLPLKEASLPSDTAPDSWAITDQPEKPFKPVKEWSRMERKTERSLRYQTAAEPPGIGVLMLRNASKNLTEEDFRRLIPQGKHIDGWTLQEADILKVVPGRHMDTLEQLNTYFILFSSLLHAHKFQWHVMRIHRLAALHTPTSNTSPIPPPPGYMIEGLDAHAAIQAYALIPPSQKLELHQLNRPYAPLVQSLVKFEGYKHLVQRPNKLPFEVRMTMEGPQLHANTLRHIMLETGRRRNLSWSGGDKYNMQITKWEPLNLPSITDKAEFAAKNAPGIREGRATDLSGRQLSDAKKSGEEEGARLRRTPQHVFILGFYTESAAQSFIAHWHKRPLEVTGLKLHHEFEEDLPPIAHVEMLW